MALPTNDKKGGKQTNKNQNNQAKGSKFIQGGAAAKPLGAVKKVRSTGANRGS